MLLRNVCKVHSSLNAKMINDSNFAELRHAVYANHAPSLSSIVNTQCRSHPHCSMYIRTTSTITCQPIKNVNKSHHQFHQNHINSANRWRSHPLDASFWNAVFFATPVTKLKRPFPLYRTTNIETAINQKHKTQTPFNHRCITYLPPTTRHPMPKYKYIVHCARMCYSQSQI